MQKYLFFANGRNSEHQCEVYGARKLKSLLKVLHKIRKHQYYHPPSS